MPFTVSRVARLAGVSVRALHHYDEIGLVRPGGRSEAGYRLYEPADLERLQQVLFFRELGLPLAEIGRILTDPKFDRRGALLMQRQLLTEKAKRLDAMIHAVNAALAAHERGEAMGGEEILQPFGGFEPAQYEDEVRARWGTTAAYRESLRRTRRYTKQDWEAMKAAGDRLSQELAEALAAGLAPADPRVTALAERHRHFIAKWFYPCSPAMHRGLGELYVADARFAQSFDRVRPGLARYVRDAFRANAERVAAGGVGGLPPARQCSEAGAAEAEGVGDHRDGAQAHRGAGDHRR
jgi:MerR family transcriptional regulator, thiopeptide resistance regulator